MGEEIKEEKDEMQGIQDGLAAKFDKSMVKKNPKGFDYIEAQAVIDRLNQTLGLNNWDFIIKSDQVYGEEIVVWGRMEVRFPDGSSAVKEDVGGKQIMYYKNKDHVFENCVDLSNDFKAAVSDCLKRCAKNLGVALYLYGEMESIESEPQDTRSQPDRRTEQPPQQPTIPAEVPKEPPKASEGKSGDIATLKVKASQLQTKCMRDDLMTKNEMDALLFTHFGQKSYPDDVVKLQAFITHCEQTIAAGR